MVAAALFLGVVVIADGAPWLGSDVGGIFSLVPVFGLTVLVLSGRRLSARTVGIALAGTIVVLGLAVGADLLRPEASRTHIANFVLDSRDGDTFWTTLSRKWSTNQRVFQQSYWTWAVPIIAVVAGYVLVVARGWKQLLPPGSPLRAGVIGVLAAGVVGWVVNDSGIVVTALVFVYLGAVPDPARGRRTVGDDRSALVTAAHEASHVVYIVGWGRSGSTLLTAVLGELDGAFAAGELRMLWGRGVIGRRLCGCGRAHPRVPHLVAGARAARGRAVQRRGDGRRSRRTASAAGTSCPSCCGWHGTVDPTRSSPATPPPTSRRWRP